VTRVWHSIAATTVAVLSALFITTGTALAATPSPASAPALHLADHHDHDGHHHWHHYSADEFDDYWHVDTDHADAQEMLNDYFGHDSDTYGSPAPTYLACPPAPGAGVSKWSCSQQPVPSPAK
jgi:hypothetical protein